MKKQILIVFQVLITVFIFASNTVADDDRAIKRNMTQKPTYNKRVALVIGNSAYEESTLLNPVNDARDIAERLRANGFEVDHQENVDKRSMVESIKAFGNSLHKKSTGLFFYAGHGIQFEGNNYLIPIDAKISNETDIEFEAIEVRRVLKKMHSANNRPNIVILDACRNNPYKRNSNFTAMGLAQMDVPTGTLIAYATSPGKVAADGNWRNSVYTKNLLKHITVPGLTLEQVLKRVRVDVLKETNGKQVPWELSSLTKDFYLVPQKLVGTDKRTIANATHSYWGKCRKIQNQYLTGYNKIMAQMNSKKQPDRAFLKNVRELSAMISKLIDSEIELSTQHVDADVVSFFYLHRNHLKRFSENYSLLGDWIQKAITESENGVPLEEAIEKMVPELQKIKYKVKTDLNYMNTHHGYEYKNLKATLEKRYNRRFSSIQLLIL